VSPQLLNSSPDSLRLAAEHLARGGLVAMPTETVYGLAGDASNPAAIERIFATKNRPRNHPLIVHVGSIEALDYWAAEVPDYARSLSSLWPGPLTLVLERSVNAADFVTGGQPTVAIRMPDHPAALALLAEFEHQGGRGLAAPSANRFGEVSPTSAVAVIDGLGEFLEATDLVLDGGDCEVGIESTIVDCTGPNPAILRPGAITAEEIESVTGIVVAEPAGTVRAPGSHKQHYSPNARVLLEGEPESGWGLIASADVKTPPGVIRLAEPIDVAAYARELYAALRRADELSLAHVIALPPAGEGLALAIRDRLTRAAAQG
jgi:L-threonylcarbamoyladenylate synthase